MIRKIVTALILVPLAIFIISFAVANRQIVVVSFDPFDRTNPAFSLAMPLFAGAAMKIAYDVLLYAAFRRRKAPEEIAGQSG